MKIIKDICNLIKTKIETKIIDKDSYISTENMLPNRQGKIAASTIPNSLYVNEFKENDILISNIRPYFKKIWFSKIQGGCSQDVLVFRAKEIVVPKFLYFLLSQDNFFDFMTGSSKGTKMPRGDLGAIKNFNISFLPPLEEQKAIADILSSLDDKIELNNKINKNLEETAQAIFKRWFVDFEFPNENGEPYKSSGGEMVESELGMIPKGWKVGCLEKTCSEIVRGYTNDYVVKSKYINLNQKVNRGNSLDRNNYKFLNENSIIPENKFLKRYDILLNSLGFGTLGRIHYFVEYDINVVADRDIVQGIS